MSGHHFKITGVLFDMIGTTVVEKNSSIVNQCFQRAFLDKGIEVNIELIKINRGREKREVVNNILNQLNYSIDYCEHILQVFNSELENNLNNFMENEGVKDTIEILKKNGIAVGIGTGLTRDIFDKIYQHLKWSSLNFDYIGVAEEIGFGRPQPDMILDMINKLKLNHYEFLKVGDTVADIQEGKNAKVWTAAILSGTQDEIELINQNPDFIIQMIPELKRIILNL